MKVYSHLTLKRLVLALIREKPYQPRAFIYLVLMGKSVKFLPLCGKNIFCANALKESFCISILIFQLDEPSSKIIGNFFVPKI